MPRIRVRYLLWLEDAAGMREEIIELGETSIEALLNLLVRLHPRLSNHLSSVFSPGNNIIVLCDGRPIHREMRISRDCTLTLLPPVSGG